MATSWMIISLDFRIAIIISTKDKARSHVASRLSSYVRTIPSLPTDEDIAKYITSHSINPLDLKLPSNKQEW